VNPGKWHIQIRKGLLELAVLNLLRHTPRHGYDMVRLLKQLEGFSIREGNIYPVLARLQAEGLVTNTIKASPDGPPRKYYELTGNGKQKLDEMNTYWNTVINSLRILEEGTLT
jgi:PadR family transcriptional regulator PadR